MNSASYTYELREGDAIIATGRLTRPTPLEVGERLTMHGGDCVVQSIQPTLNSAEPRLLIRLIADP